MFKKHSTKIIVFSFFLVSILLSSFLIKGDIFYFAIDYPFHFNRVLGVAEALKQGEFFNTIDFNTMGGLGYLNPIFYSNIFLYPFAILKILGLSNISVITCIIFFTYFLTQLVSFFSAKSYFKNNLDSLIFTLIFTFSSYHLFDITYRGAIGELFGLMMLPMPLFAFLNIQFKNDYKKWWVLSLGLLLVFINHNITTLLLIVLFIILYNLNIYKNKNFKEITITFIKSGIFFIIISLFYTIPMLFSSMSQEFNVAVNSAFNLSDTTKLIEYLPFNEFLFNSILNNPIGLHIGLVGIFSILFGLIRFKKLNKMSKQFLIIIIITISSMYLFMDTGILDNSFLNIIQFSWRFYIIIIPMIGILFINILETFKNKKIIDLSKKGSIIFYLIVIVLFKIIYSTFLLPTVATNDVNHTWYINNNKNYTYDIGAGREYLPSVLEPKFNDYADLKELPTKISSNKETTNIKNINKEFSSIEFDVISKDMDIVEIPFIYYKDFFKVTSNGEPVKFEMSDNGLIQIKVKDNDRTHIEVKHKNPWYIHTSWILTVVLTLLFIYIIKKTPHI